MLPKTRSGKILRRAILAAAEKKCPVAGLRARQVGSHLRGDRVFAMSGLGAPVRLEIGPYQALMKYPSRLSIRSSLWLRTSA